MSNRLQHERYELKYLINEEKALRIRDFVRSYLDMDEYCVEQPGFSYPTLSLYLDSDALDTYWHTINGNRNRFKLRLRYYDDRPSTPVFFEIKRREDNVILKDRGGVKKDAVRLLLAGHMPERDHLLQPGDVDQFVAVQRFCQLMLDIHARPKMHIAYMREAFESAENNGVRLTFDRSVESAPMPRAQLIARSAKPHSVFGKTVILELKFTARFPKWFRELVETFNLMQAGAAKFAEGIFSKGEDWVHRACVPEPPEVVLDDFLTGRKYPDLFPRGWFAGRSSDCRRSVPDGGTV